MEGSNWILEAAAHQDQGAHVLRMAMPELKGDLNAHAMAEYDGGVPPHTCEQNAPIVSEMADVDVFRIIWCLALTVSTHVHVNHAAAALEFGFQVPPDKTIASDSIAEHKVDGALTGHGIPECGSIEAFKGRFAHWATRQRSWTIPGVPPIRSRNSWVFSS